MLLNFPVPTKNRLEKYKIIIKYVTNDYIYRYYYNKFRRNLL